MCPTRWTSRRNWTLNDMKIAITILSIIALVLLASFGAYAKCFRTGKNRHDDFYILPEGKHFEEGREEMFALMKGSL